jgi:hypothetical protein
MTLKLKITPTEFVAGPFDAANRYIRKSASGARFPIPTNKTININLDTIGSSVINYSPVLRYSVNGVVRQRTRRDEDLEFSQTHVAVNPGSYNSTVVLVKT